MIPELKSYRRINELKDKIVVLKIGNEIYLFKSEHITSEQRIIIESITEALWDDYESEIAELNHYELLNWVLEKIRIETGIGLESIEIDCEFSISAH